MESSDNYRMWICKRCGSFCTVNPERNKYECRQCKNETFFAQIRLPYACKLLFQEVQSLGIDTKFITN